MSNKNNITTSNIFRDSFLQSFIVFHSSLEVFLTWLSSFIIFFRHLLLFLHHLLLHISFSLLLEHLNQKVYEPVGFLLGGAEGSICPPLELRLKFFNYPLPPPIVVQICIYAPLMNNPERNSDQCFKIVTW